jgi:hypothetical protein
LSCFSDDSCPWVQCQIFSFPKIYLQPPFHVFFYQLRF